jgi:hypothetical protein
MFRHRERITKILGIVLAVSLLLSLVLPFLIQR